MKSGLILALVTIICSIPSDFLYLMKPGFWSGLLSILLWVIKFAACIWVMKHYLVLFKKEHSSATRANIRRYGLAIAISSALIVSAYKFVDMVYINPDASAQMVNTLMDSYSTMLSSSEMDKMEEALADLPSMTFFFMFFYCIIYGAILSGILSRNIAAPDSIFDEIDTNNESDHTDE